LVAWDCHRARDWACHAASHGCTTVPKLGKRLFERDRRVAWRFEREPSMRGASAHFMAALPPGLLDFVRVLLILAVGSDAMLNFSQVLHVLRIVLRCEKHCELPAAFLAMRCCRPSEQLVFLQLEKLIESLPGNRFMECDRQQLRHAQLRVRRDGRCSVRPR
jgi:hypothetical protein